MRRGAGPVGVISAHLDDAVLSCSGQISAGAKVVTVFASGPSRIDELSAWDAASGCFVAGDDVYTMRAVEDDRALASLGATGHRLAFWDLQYRQPWRTTSSRISRISRRTWARLTPADRTLAASIVSELDLLVGSAGITTWFAPLGIGHPDHHMLGSILPELVRRHTEVDWHVYDDLPYAFEAPSERDSAHLRLKRAGLRVTPVDVSAVDTERKRTALSFYQSQLIPLGERVEVAVAGREVVHRVSAETLS